MPPSDYKAIIINKANPGERRLKPENAAISVEPVAFSIQPMIAKTARLVTR